MQYTLLFVRKFHLRLTCIIELSISYWLLPHLSYNSMHVLMCE